MGVAVPAGRWADRWGRRRLIVAAGLAAAAGTSLLLAAPSTTTALFAGAILGLAVGVFQVASWAMVTQVVPGQQAGRMLGLANIATAVGSGLARLGGGLIIDPVNRLAGSTSAGYLLLYGLAAAAFLAGTVAILRAPDEGTVAGR
jgi:MFS family permease